MIYAELNEKVHRCMENTLMKVAMGEKWKIEAIHIKESAESLLASIAKNFNPTEKVCYSLLSSTGVPRKFNFLSIFSAKDVFPVPLDYLCKKKISAKQETV